MIISFGIFIIFFSTQYEKLKYLFDKIIIFCSKECQVLVRAHYIYVDKIFQFDFFFPQECQVLVRAHYVDKIFQFDLQICVQLFNY